MFEWPRLVILLVTYKRIEELTQSVLALHNLIKYPLDRTIWVVSDDSSPDNYPEQVINIWTEHSLPTSAVYTSTATNSGLGANMNNSLMQFRDYPVFQMESDYIPKRSLDLMAGVALLRKAPHIGMLRYRGTAGMRCTYHQQEADIIDMYPDYFSGEGAQGKLNYLELDPQSPTLYLYSNGPHLKSPSFHTYYGLYPEGLKLGATEESYAHIVKDGMQNANAPKIAILPDFVEMRFDHIGKTFQHSDLDKGV